MSHRIAIIEDEKPIEELYRLKLEADGFHVQSAANGEEGLKLLEDFEPHAVLLDIMMPQMDGYEVLKHAHKRGLLPEATIILTNLAYDDVRQRAHKYPVADIFVKVETTPVIVVDRVKQILN